MTITAIEPQKGDPNRLNIFADGKFVLGVSLRIWEKSRFACGMEISKEDILQLLEEENIYKAKKKAMTYLDYAEHSVKSMRDKLIRAEFDEDIARAAVDELCDEGILDDEKYANRYAYYLYNKKMYGRHRVIMEIASKGVDRALAQSAADEQMPDDFAPMIRALAKKRVKSVKNASSNEYDKLFAYLLRYGHEYGDIKEVLDEIF